MDEEEFDALRRWRPFGTEDAMRLFNRDSSDIELRMRLGAALWGRTSEDLRRQLLAPHPEIPPGFDLADFASCCNDRAVEFGNFNVPTDAGFVACCASSHGRFRWYAWLHNVGSPLRNCPPRESITWKTAEFHGFVPLTVAAPSAARGGTDIGLERRPVEWLAVSLVAFGGAQAWQRAMRSRGPGQNRPRHRSDPSAPQWMRR